METLDLRLSTVCAKGSMRTIKSLGTHSARHTVGLREKAVFFLPAFFPVWGPSEERVSSFLSKNCGQN